MKGRVMLSTRKILAGLLALPILASAQVLAADSTDADVERLKKDARAVGEDYAEKGQRIADRAVDFANDVADDFTDSYEKAKEDATSD